MKKITILSLLLAFATSSVCQQTSQKPTVTPIDYLQKSKKQKKRAVILLVVGAGLVVTSVVIPNGELTYDGICIGAYCSDKYKNDGIRAAFAVSGVASMLGSIPFFIASGKNKKRAARGSVFINMEKTPVLQGMAFRNQSFPVIGISLGL